MSNLFIDPSSILLGFAEYSKRGELLDHFSIQCDPKEIMWKRFAYIKFELNKKYKDRKFDMVVIEQMSGGTYIQAKWAVGGMLFYFSDKTKYMTQINVSHWKKAFNLSIKDKGKKVEKVFRKYFPTEKVDTDDEMEAILFGLAFLKTKGKGMTKKCKFSY